ncbi:hypothetical protein WJX72_000899 [[Myrmecia] bisecta]|uniref:Uncharacterized protein n=1 Tax=[Myrmecia] bisecta TaxID=41462 RepID=A0AAW1Q9V0_9CHLO
MQPARQLPPQPAPMLKDRAITTVETGAASRAEHVPAWRQVVRFTFAVGRVALVAAISAVVTDKVLCNLDAADQIKKQAYWEAVAVAREARWAREAAAQTSHASRPASRLASLPTCPEPAVEASFLSATHAIGARQRSTEQSRRQLRQHVNMSGCMRSVAENLQCLDMDRMANCVGAAYKRKPNDAFSGTWSPW